MFRRRNRGLCLARIDDDDPRLAIVRQYPLPKNRGGDAKMRTDQDDDIGLFKISVSVRRRVKPEGFLVGRRGCGHALAGVAVAMDDTHTELGKGAQKSQFFSHDLAGTQPCHRRGSVMLLNGLEASNKFTQGLAPADGPPASVGIPQQRDSGPIIRGEWCQRFPSFGAGHAQIDRIIAPRREVDGFTVLQMEIQTASGGTKAAHAAGPRIRFEPGWNSSQPEIAGSLYQFAGEFPVPLSNEPRGAVDQRN